MQNDEGPEHTKTSGEQTAIDVQIGLRAFPIGRRLRDLDRVLRHAFQSGGAALQANAALRQIGGNHD